MTCRQAWLEQQEAERSDRYEKALKSIASHELPEHLRHPEDFSPGEFQRLVIQHHIELAEKALGGK